MCGLCVDKFHQNPISSVYYCACVGIDLCDIYEFLIDASLHGLHANLAPNFKSFVQLTNITCASVKGLSLSLFLSLICLLTFCTVSVTGDVSQ